MSASPRRPEWLFKALRCITGFFLFHFFPRRQIVFLASSMRSGSTLLKALMAEAPDASNLPEVDTANFPRNRYAFYYRAQKLSPCRIIVFKRPFGMPVSPRYPFLPCGLNILIIALVRDPAATWESFERRRVNLPDGHSLKNLATPEAFVSLWVRGYGQVLDMARKQPLPCRWMVYENLAADPEGETARLFQFIGSSRKEGAGRYRNPEGYDWKWGKDDGGQKIRSLVVQPAELAGEDIRRCMASFFQKDSEGRKVLLRMKEAGARAGWIEGYLSGTGQSS